MSNNNINNNMSNSNINNNINNNNNNDCEMEMPELNLDEISPKLSPKLHINTSASYNSNLNEKSPMHYRTNSISLLENNNNNNKNMLSTPTHRKNAPSLCGFHTSTPAPINQLRISYLGSKYVKKVDLTCVDDLLMVLNDLNVLDNKNDVWIDLCSPSIELVEETGKYFKLHPLTIEDCHLTLVELEQEKLEVFNLQKYIYLQTHALNEYYEVNAPIPVKVVIFNHLILSFHAIDVKPLADYIEWYCRQSKSTLTPSYTLYGLLKSVTTQLVEVVRNVSLEIDSIEELIEVLSHSERSDLSKRMSRVRRLIVHCENLVLPKRHVIQSMMRLSTQDRDTSKDAFVSNWFSNTHLLHDLLDQNNVLQSRLRISQDLLSSIQSMYLARASLAVSDASHRLNSEMSRLSVVATITLPLTLLTSFWGMNVTVPGQHSDGSKSLTAFFVIFLSELFCLLVGVWYFKRSGYL